MTGALVLAVYSVDNFDLRRAITDYQCRFYAIPSFVEFVGAKYRLVPISGPLGSRCPRGTLTHTRLMTQNVRVGKGKCAVRQANFRGGAS